jgi:hypothetical protein
VASRLSSRFRVAGRHPANRFLFFLYLSQPAARLKCYRLPMSTTRQISAAALAILFIGTGLACAQLDLHSLPGAKGSSQSADGSGFSSDQAAGGLKEALSQGISTSISSTGHPGGYFDDAAIKILMPPPLQRIQSGMRAAGMGAQVDSFVKSMNSAAEEAAPEAKSILLDALRGMSITDAKSIVLGGKTAGTDYFKQKTTAQIQTAFRPIVERSMAKTGVTEQFTALMSKAPATPFMKTPKVDINQYVLDKAVDGLFIVMAQEETKIRTDPAAQVTPLLKTVFGHH